MKTIGKAFGRIKSSRLYHKLFVAQINPRRVDELKEEIMLKYHGKGWF